MPAGCGPDTSCAARQEAATIRQGVLASQTEAISAHVRKAYESAPLCAGLCAVQLETQLAVPQRQRRRKHKRLQGVEYADSTFAAQLDKQAGKPC
jgi:hypothetical protein